MIRSLWPSFLLVALAGVTAPAWAGDPIVPPSKTELPAMLSMHEAVRMLHTRGLDLMIIDAQVAAAEGDVHIAGALINPNVSVGAGPAFNYSAQDTPARPCPGCQPYAVQWGISDNGAVLDAAVGKRGLRVDVARRALAAARLGRADAERQLASQVKQAYIAVAVATQALEFSVDVDKSLMQTLELARLRYPSVINDGDLARIEVQKLEADQAVDSARADLRQARVSLALLLGVRGPVPDFDVSRDSLKFSVPGLLAATSEQELFARAVDARQDLKAAAAQVQRSNSAVELAERQRVPDVSLFAQYTQLGMGQNVGQPMNLVLGLSTNLPVFYQQGGEIMKARADRDLQALSRERTLAQIASDVSTSYAAFVAARDLLRRMDGALLERARRARDITDVQYKNGGATLMDFLDAQRTYIATNREYLQDLSGYWTAIYQLEQAIGTELQ